jgi:PAS domain S-box-containing protein
VEDIGDAGREYQPVLESITRLALDPGLRQDDLLRALAENLAVMNQGLALLVCDFQQGEVWVEAAFAADGTSYPLDGGTARLLLRRARVCQKHLHSWFSQRARCFANLQEALGGPLQERSLLTHAFAGQRLVLLPLWRDNGHGEAVLIAGEDLGAQRVPALIRLADRLALALQIQRLREEVEGAHQEQIRAFQQADWPLLLLDAAGHIREVNPAAAELLAVPGEELRGQPLWELFPDCASWFKEERAGSEGGERAARVCEAEYRPPGRVPRVLRIQGREVNNGGHRGLLVSLQDVSQLRRLEGMVQRLDQLKEDIAAHLAVGIVMLDVNGYCAHVNRAAASILGRREEDLLGERWTQVVPEDQMKIFREADERCRCGRYGRYEMDLLHASGERIHALISETPTQEAGRYAGKILLLTDITARRRAELRLEEQGRAFRRVLGRLAALNQAASGAIRGLDGDAIIRLVGDELKHLGMQCVVLTRRSSQRAWLVRYVSQPIARQGKKKKALRGGSRWILDAERAQLLQAMMEAGRPRFFPPAPADKASTNPLLAWLQVQDGYQASILAPMVSSEDLGGLLLVWGPDLIEEDLQAIAAFANHLSVALESAHLFSRSIQQAEHGRILAEIAASASTESDIAVLLHRAAERILDALDLKACTFFLREGEGQALTALLSVSRPPGSPLEELPAPGSVMALSDLPWPLEEIGPSEVRHLPGIWPADGRSKGLRSKAGMESLVLPMRASGETFGLAVFYRTRGKAPLDAGETLFLGTAIEQLSLAFEKVRLQGEAQVQFEIDRSLARLVERTLASQDVDHVVSAALEGVLNLIPCHWAAVTRFDEDEDQAEVLGLRGDGGRGLRPGQILSLNEWGLTDALRAGRVVRRQTNDPSVSACRLDRSLQAMGFVEWISIPLVSQGEILGALTLASRQGGTIQQTHLALARRFADQLAVALKNASHYAQVRRQAEELSALYELALGISGELELYPLLSKAVQNACQLVGADRGAVFLLDEVDGQLVMGSAYKLDAPLNSRQLPIERGFAGRVYRAGEALILSRPGETGDPPWLYSCYARGAALGVPLYWAGEVQGVLAVYSAQDERAFTKDEGRLLERMAAQISLGMASARKHERIRRQANQLRVVQDLGRRITSILDQNQLFREVVLRVAHSFHLELVVLFMVAGEYLTEVASYYSPEDSFGFWQPVRVKIGEEGLAGRAAAEGRTLVANDVESDRRFLRALPVEGQICSAMAVPLKLKGEVVGVLLAESERKNAFDDTDAAILESLGAFVSTSLENARLYAEKAKVQSRLIEIEKLRSLGLMTSGIAHDFNNLLAVILARAELALQRIDDPKARQHLEQVIASARDGGETIHRLQDFARTRQDTSDFVGVDLNQIVREAVELSRPRWKDQAQSAGIDVAIELDLRVERPIMGAPSQLREILLNLIFNAVEAMPEGGTVRITTASDEQYALIVVEDDGVGMTEEVKEQIFVPYFTTKEGGTGLGLSMVYGVVQRHGGDIEVTTEPGKGSCFVVRLPTTSQPPGDKPTPRQEARKKTAPNASILVVEDEQPIREALIEILEEEGYLVHHAEDGEQALRALQKRGSFDLVITDLGMPRMGGWELIEAIRALYRQVPVMIISGWGDQIDPERLQALNIVHVVAKPFTVRSILNGLSKALTVRSQN